MTSDRPGDLIARTRALYQTVLGESPELTTDFSVAFGALVEGAADIVVELPWEEEQSGAVVERHQIVLHSVSDDGTRVLFYNPAAAHGLETGTELGTQPRQGVPRRVEPDGLQSVDLSLLARFFAEGKAHALIPPSGMFE